MLLDTPITPPPTLEVPTVTIFVHGTQRTARFFCPENLPIFSPFAAQFLPTYLQNKIDFVYTTFTHKPGLFQVDKAHQNYCWGQVLRTICTYDSVNFPPQHAFIFCWSGILSHEARVQAAHELHTSLCALHATYSTQYSAYRLVIITHSHGGNVVLNLATLTDEKPYSIDHLIIMAAPVQEKTKHLVDSPLFKKITAPHSHVDLLHVLDPQGFGYRRKLTRRLFTREGSADTEQLIPVPFFSQRHFPSDKVHHVNIVRRISGLNHGLGHLEFILQPFTTQLTQILAAADIHDYSTGECTYVLKKASSIL